MDRIAGCYRGYHAVNKRYFKNWQNGLRYGHFWMQAGWKALKLGKTVLCFMV